MKNELMIFGNGEISEIVSRYFIKENKFNILGYIVDDENMNESTFLKKPIIAKSEFFSKYNFNDFNIHIAISYKKLNQNRYKIYNEFKSKKFNLVSFISKKINCGENVSFGNNCFIQENQTFQDNVIIGNNVMIWSGNHIGHGSVISDHTYISSHNVISGHVKIGERCFIGVNSSFKDFIEVGDDCLIGMCAKIMSNIKSNSVVIEEPSKIFNEDTRQAKYIKNRI